MGEIRVSISAHAIHEDETLKPILTERTCLLPKWVNDRLAEGQTRRQIAEDVAAHGLSSEEYIAVIHADLGVGGVVNGNNRIYPPLDFVGQNRAMAHRIGEGEFIASEAGHPDGLPTLNVAARLIEVEVIGSDGTVIALTQTEEGRWVLPEDAPPLPSVVRSRGRLAFLRTTEGQNAWVLYRAGMPLGTSSRGRGFTSPHTLDDDSPYIGANENLRGQVVDLVEGWELDAYDIVTIPSAGTFVSAATDESVRAAYRQLVEAKILPDTGDTGNEDENMDPITLAILEAKNPELLKQIREAAAAEAAPQGPLAEAVANLDENKGKVLAAFIKALDENANVDARAPAKATKEAIAAMEAKMEAITTTIAEKVETLTTSLGEAEARLGEAQTELKTMREAEEARVTAAKIATDLDEALGKIHKNLRDAVREHVAADVKAGRLVKTEDIADAVTRTAKLIEKYSDGDARSRGGAGSPPGDNDNDGGGEGDNDEGATLSEVDKLMETLLPKDWRSGLAEALGREPEPDPDPTTH